MNHVDIDNVKVWDGARVDGQVYAQLESSVEFSNDSAKPIKVAMRNGFKFVLAPNYSKRATTRQLKVRLKIALDRTVSNQFITMMNEEPNAQRRGLIQKALTLWSNSMTLRPEPFRVEYVISQKLFQANEGTLYVKDLDCAFTTNIDDPDFCHPNSVEMGLKNMVTHVSPYHDEPDHQYVFSICIVDNAEKIGPRWIKTHTGISKITPMRSEKLDGFYIVRTSDATSALEPGKINQEFHETEETLGDIRLFKSWSEAATSDGELKAKMELNEIQSKLMLSENTLEKLKLERDSLERNKVLNEDRYKFEIEKITRERDQALIDSENNRQKNEREIERHLREIDRMTRDAQLAKETHEQAIEKIRIERDRAREVELQDAKSSTRKTIMEIVKMMGTVVAGIFSIATFIMKLRSPSSK